jgi:hypothetical protein
MSPLKVVDTVVRKKSVSLEQKFNSFDCLPSCLFTAYGSKNVALYNNNVFIITDSCVTLELSVLCSLQTQGLSSLKTVAAYTTKQVSSYNTNG